MGSLAQRRDPKVYDVEAVIQIRAEAASRHFLFQFAVSGGDYSGIDLSGLLAAHALETSFLKIAQKLGLQVKRQFCYLVEKYRPASAASNRPGLSR